MSETLTIDLHNRQQARAALTAQVFPFLAAVLQADKKYTLTIKPRTRSIEQNAKFHAICADLERSHMQWAGKPRTAGEWKVLLVSGHAVATKEGVDIIPGLENEFVNVRDETSKMTRARGASLITYAQAFCDLNGVRLSASEYQE